ncbi:hypothetical protein [Chromohalobacter canadensis]|nr:hypothetical protein [Chromohalobacter canadensis]
MYLLRIYLATPYQMGATLHAAGQASIDAALPLSGGTGLAFNRGV